MRRITGLVAVSVLFLAACGDDDDNAGSAGSVQNDAAGEIIQQAKEGNLDPDEDCIREKAANLSDEDAQKIIDAGISDTPDLSPAGLAVIGETASCLSGDALMNQIVENLPEDVDGDCVRGKLQDIDFGAMFESGTLPPAIEQAVTDCGTG